MKKTDINRKENDMKSRTLKELWDKRNRLIALVEQDKSCGKWCHMDGGYFVPNEKGSAKILRITSTYKNMRKRIVDGWIESGVINEKDILSEFMVFDGDSIPSIRRDYAKAYYKYQDMPI